MNNKIEKIKCYLDSPEQMAKDKFSLFVALEEILHIRAGSNDRTLDRDIYEIFHQVFSFYVEPNVGTEIWTDENGEILKQAEVSFPSGSINNSKIQNEICEFMLNASNQNQKISSQIYWCYYSDGFIDAFSTDMIYKIRGFYEGRPANWDDFQKCLIGNLYGKETPLQRICRLYLKCDFPFSYKVKYIPYQNDECINTLSIKNISETWVKLKKEKMISGEYEDYLLLCQKKETPKNKLTWELESPKRNGLAMGAFLEFLEFLGYDKGDRKRIKKTAKAFFNLEIPSSSHDRKNKSAHYKVLKEIFQ